MTKPPIASQIKTSREYLLKPLIAFESKTVRFLISLQPDNFRSFVVLKSMFDFIGNLMTTFSLTCSRWSIVSLASKAENYVKTYPQSGNAVKLFVCLVICYCLSWEGFSVFRDGCISEIKS
jgi:hypothetical protein